MYTSTQEKSVHRSTVHVLFKVERRMQSTLTCFIQTEAVYTRVTNTRLRMQFSCIVTYQLQCHSGYVTVSLSGDNSAAKNTSTFETRSNSNSLSTKKTSSHAGLLFCFVCYSSTYWQAFISVYYVHMFLQ